MDGILFFEPFDHSLAKYTSYYMYKSVFFMNSNPFFTLFTKHGNTVDVISDVIITTKQANAKV